MQADSKQDVHDILVLLSQRVLLPLPLCLLQDFARMFGNPLRGRAYPLDFMGLGKPLCMGYLGCMYI